MNFIKYATLPFNGKMLLFLFPYREVYVDPDTAVPYDIVMSKVDVKYGMFGLNNFYKMQVRPA